MTIRLILDTSAVVAYANESVDVGEVIAEITDEGVSFAVPDACLAEATIDAKPEQREILTVLAGHPHRTDVALPDWREWAVAAALYGGLTRGLVALVAAEYGAYIVTAEPDVYGGLPTIGV